MNNGLIIITTFFLSFFRSREFSGSTRISWKVNSHCLANLFKNLRVIPVLHHCRWTTILYLIKDWLQGWIFLDTSHSLFKLLLMSWTTQVLKHTGHSRILHKSIPKTLRH